MFGDEEKAGKCFERAIEQAEENIRQFERMREERRYETIDGD